MKKLEQNKKNNKGFSLVELIVVIAIMIVLVAVLAPVFTKYVEQSRRATDVQNANTIASAILVYATDNTDENKAPSTTTTAVLPDTFDGLKSVPAVKGKVGGSNPTFYYKYNDTKNTVEVYVGDDTHREWSGDLTQESNAQEYKNSDETNGKKTISTK